MLRNTFIGRCTKRLLIVLNRKKKRDQCFSCNLHCSTCYYYVGLLFLFVCLPWLSSSNMVLIPICLVGHSKFAMNPTSCSLQHNSLLLLRLKQFRQKLWPTDRLKVLHINANKCRGGYLSQRKPEKFSLAGIRTLGTLSKDYGRY